MTRILIDQLEINHGYPFDPTYGYSLEALLSVETPPEPEDFEAFWRNRYAFALQQDPEPKLTLSHSDHPRWKVYDLRFTSTHSFTLGGWVIVPQNGEVKQGIVAGHGYGGREGPDLTLPFENTAILFPCCRGISRSQSDRIPAEPNRHVIHGIDNRDTYVIGGCVDDHWLAVSALLQLFPEVAGKIGWLGVSFSGGINMLAAPWDERVSRSHNNVPTFGNQALRLTLPSVGSASGVADYERRHPGQTQPVLRYFDAASAAKRLRHPCHLACARFDPAVAPPGQFAIYNALPTDTRQLFVLSAGHHDYASQSEENTQLLRELRAFFSQGETHL
ncbi:acetylxylan esterase [Pelagicoccus sp. NFK12]|uniref:Acetylxylan esterase n=1 Tax=Pelagicoccus enzymogenes TaxID=2773457 RepID=A0A927F5K5_9BACT|nr:acetylxylan esterase [Pelagicoccus enzymogenes]MBD5778808.1 acetylxylan esterase [Pelagicoccus enzymogenes]